MAFSTVSFERNCSALDYTKVRRCAIGLLRVGSVKVLRLPSLGNTAACRQGLSAAVVG
jgi:hypothetical protein